MAWGSNRSNSLAPKNYEHCVNQKTQIDLTVSKVRQAPSIHPSIGVDR